MASPGPARSPEGAGPGEAIGRRGAALACRDAPVPGRAAGGVRAARARARPGGQRPYFTTLTLTVTTVEEAAYLPVDAAFTRTLTL